MGTIYDLFVEYNPSAQIRNVTDAYWDIYNFMESLMYEGQDKIREKQGYIPGSPFSCHCGEMVAISGSYLDTFETRLDEFLRKTCIKYNLVCPPIHARNSYNGTEMIIGFEYD